MAVTPTMTDLAEASILLLYLFKVWSSMPPPVLGPPTMHLGLLAELLGIGVPLAGHHLLFLL
jgi:hypothetical protein